MSARATRHRLRRVVSLRPKTSEAVAFESLLAALDPDRERAGEKYELLRQKLVRFFIWRDCPAAEELADETLDRVAHRLAAGEVQSASQPTSFIFGVARNVLRESWDRSRQMSPLAKQLSQQAEEIADQGPVEDDREGERRWRLLNLCLERLPASERQLILRYFTGHHGSQIPLRQALAAELGLAPNALRIRVHRIREKLVRCLRAAGGLEAG